MGAAANRTIIADLESEIYTFLRIIHKYSTSQMIHFLTATLNPKFLLWFVVVFLFHLVISRELVVDAKNFGARDTCLQMCNTPPPTPPSTTHLSQRSVAK